MKGWKAWAALATAPLILIALVCQTGFFASKAAEARSLEEQQRAWVDANRRLQGGISVLESRERAADLADKLKLGRAGANRRIFIVTPRAGGQAAPAPAPEGRHDG